jgi:hypothetical protein
MVSITTLGARAGATVAASRLHETVGARPHTTITTESTLDHFADAPDVRPLRITLSFASSQFTRSPVSVTGA